jgi:hypothetical protein
VINQLWKRSNKKMSSDQVFQDLVLIKWVKHLKIKKTSLKSHHLVKVVEALSVDLKWEMLTKNNLNLLRTKHLLLEIFR